MKRKMRSLLGLTAILFSAIQFVACNKHYSDDAPPPVAQRQLRIQFTAASLSINQVDSAQVILTRTGAQPITKKLELGNNVFFATTNDIPTGTWKAEWLIYTKKPATPNTHGRQHMYANEINFPLNTNSTVVAPSGDWNAGWLPRVHTHDPIKNFTIIAALDFSDPYYAIITKGTQKIRYFYIDRIAKLVNGANSQLIGAEAIEKFTNIPPEGVMDKTSFKSLTEEIQGKQWNRGEILVEILDSENAESVFYFQYDKN